MKVETKKRKTRDKKHIQAEEFIIKEYFEKYTDEKKANNDKTQN